MPNLGQFGMGANVNPVQAAIQARQTGGAPVSALNQMSGAAQAGSSPAPQAPVGPAPAMPAPQMSPTAQAPTSEAEIIVKALNDRLKSISKVEEFQSQPQQAPVGGGGKYCGKY